MISPTMLHSFESDFLDKCSGITRPLQVALLSRVGTFCLDVKCLLQLVCGTL
jgi:hypothetical protein